MLPVLKALADEAELTTTELRNRVATAEALTHEDVSTRLRPYVPAQFPFRGTELIEQVRRVVYRLTSAGEELLAEGPAPVDENVLRAYPAQVEWQQSIDQRKQPEQSPQADQPMPEDEAMETAEESLNHAANKLRLMFEGEVLKRVRDAAPELLEQAIVNLLIAMGYGGGDPVMGRSPDVLAMEGSTAWFEKTSLSWMRFVSRRKITGSSLALARGQ